VNCIICQSIYLRPAEPEWSGEGNAQWARRFCCGGCGAVFVIRVARIGAAPTDPEKHQARVNPPPKVMLENGGHK